MNYFWHYPGTILQKYHHMAGIYIHIPFCRQACFYCNFHFSTQLKNTEEIILTICREAAERKNYLSTPVDTIYFGGGTPSCIGTNALSKIIETLEKNFSISPGVEITLEANPDDISAVSLAEWKTIGINRLSVGIQSFFEKHLQWMNRSHSAIQAEKCIDLIRNAGFTNFSIDLIYGIPGLSNKEWAENLLNAIRFNIPHISCYALTVEPKTALHQMIRQHKKEDVDEGVQSAQFHQLVKKMRAANYHHYEISNFAQPGFESRHNSSYWLNKEYLGLGPSAHSYNGESRQWNISNNALYIKNVNNTLPFFEIEYLTATQKFNEWIMTSLRTSTGISLEKINKYSGDVDVAGFLNDIKKWIEAGNIKLRAGHYTLTRKGKFFADGIAADLFREEIIHASGKG